MNDLTSKCDAARKVIVSLKSKYEKTYFVLLEMSRGKNGQTIGDNLNVTRESIRQRKNSGLKKITKSLNLIFSEPCIKKQNYITGCQLHDVYSNAEIVDIVLFWCRSGNIPFEYLDFADVIVPAGKYGSMAEKIWQDVRSIMTDGGIDGYPTMSALMTVLEEDSPYPYMNEPAVIKLLTAKRHFLFNDNIFYVNRDEVDDLCLPIIANYFLDGINLDDDGSKDMDKLRDICRSIYGEQIVENKLSSYSYLYNRLRNNLILYGQSLYISPQNIKNKDAKLSFVHKVADEFIDQRRSSTSRVSDNAIYKAFPKDVKAAGIDNPQFLHGLLTYCFPYRYKSDRGGIIRLDIKGKSIPRIKRIENRVEERPRHKDDLRIEIDVSTDTFFTDVKESERLFFDGDGNVRSLTHYNYKPNLICILRNNVQSIMEKHNGYCNGFLLTEKIKEIIKNKPQDYFDNKEEKTIKEAIEDFRDPDIVFGFTSKVLKDEYIFANPHIVRKDIDIGEINWSSVLLYIMGKQEKLTYDCIFDKLNELHCPYGSKNTAVQQLRKMYLRVSQNELVIRESLTVDNQVSASVGQLVEDNISNGFVTISNVENNILEKLPQIGNNSWNGFLLHSMVDEYLSDRYRVIEIAGIDWKQESGVIVRAESGIFDFVDLVVKYIKQHGKTRMSGIAMLEVMRKEFGLHYLPREIRQKNDRIFYSARMNAYLLDGSEEGDTPEPKLTLEETREKLRDWLSPFSADERLLLMQKLRYCEPFCEFPELFNEVKG